MRFLDPNHLLATFGTAGLLTIIFAECGLMVGFFLPGDSLLFTAGLLASQGKLSMAIVLPGCFLAAVAGAQVGFLIGRRFGPALFRRPDSRFFRQEYVDRARAYYDRHGARTIVLARFVPIVRTFANVVAGVGQMEPRSFLVFNVIGAFIWTIGVTLLGYTLGKTVPSIDRYLLPVIALIVVASAIPVLLEMLRSRRAREES